MTFLSLQRLAIEIDYLKLEFLRLFDFWFSYTLLNYCIVFKRVQQLIRRASFSCTLIILQLTQFDLLFVSKPAFIVSLTALVRNRAHNLTDSVAWGNLWRLLCPTKLLMAQIPLDLSRLRRNLTFFILDVYLLNRLDLQQAWSRLVTDTHLT